MDTAFRDHFPALARHQIQQLVHQERRWQRPHSASWYLDLFPITQIIIFFFFKLFNLEEVALIYHFCYTCIWGSGKNWAIPCPIVTHFESEWPELSAPNSEGTPCANKPTAWVCARLHRKYLLLPKNSSKVKTLDKSQLRKFITQS